MTEQLQFRTILPALTVIDGLLSDDDDDEFLIPSEVYCELEEIFLAGGIDFGAFDADSPTASSSDTKRRKRTHELRKDEIDTLKQNTEALSSKLDFLKHRAGIQDEQSVVQQELNNSVLREILCNQQFLVAGFRSLMSSDTSETVLSPVSTRIHLKSDLVKRRKLLRDIKFQKIHDARRFLESRTQYSPMTSRFSESTSHLTHEGDAIAVRLDIVPLPEAKSVKQVFDAIMFYFAHQEICMTEVLGDVTVRESTAGSADKARNVKKEKKREDTTQHRFLYTSHDNIKVETNSVQFSEYKLNHRCAQSGGLREDAIVATDFVDQDDLFPYSPHERIRKDITCIMHVQSCERPRNTQDSSTQCASPGRGDGQGFATSFAGGMQEDGNAPYDSADHVVVLTTWFQTNLRRCEFEIPEDKVLELVEDSDHVHEAILKSVRVSV